MKTTETTTPPEAIEEIKTLTDLVVDLLRSGEQFTDLHVESDQPAMLRRSVNDWSELKDARGKPIVVKHAAIKEFLDGVFAQQDGAEADIAVDGAWRYRLNDAGSLHPAVTQNYEDLDGSVASVRMRCTVQKQMMGQSIGVVLRPLREIPKSVDSLGLPIQAGQLLQSASSGLIVITGPTGSGKSTTLAAMINEINERRRANILTIEDPVEFVHERKLSIINQRELGVDVNTYESGVRDALRFVPDVILIGEIRDAQTMLAAVRAAESGHLVLTTMHAPTAGTAIRKMLAYFDNSQADGLALSACLIGVIAQALIRGKDGKKIHLAYEVLNCRDTKVMEAVAGGVTDASGKQFATLDASIRQGSMGNATIPMIRSLKELVSNGSVDKRLAANVAWHPDEKSELLRMDDSQQDRRANTGRSV